VLGETGTYAPGGPSQANTLATIEPGKGYMVRLKEAASLEVGGEPVGPSTPIVLTQGWHWLGYLGTGQKSVPEALASIQGSYSWLLGEEGTHAPPPAPSHFNNLFTMQEGKGYLIKVTAPASIVFGP
jgi:hypothetical protein